MNKESVINKINSNISGFYEKTEISELNKIHDDTLILLSALQILELITDSVSSFLYDEIYHAYMDVVHGILMKWNVQL